MNIKAFTHAAQQHLKASIPASIPKTHLYEFLAAAFGYGSYAALRASATFYTHAAAGTAPVASAVLEGRCRELGYAPIAALIAEQLGQFIARRKLQLLDIDSIVRQLRDDESEFPSVPVDELLPPAHLEALRAAASGGQGLAHYALALFHESQGGRRQASGAFWDQQERKGIVLQGVEKEWAQAYREQVAHADLRRRHLDAAAALGNPLALFDLALESGDPRFFDAFPLADASLGLHPREVAEVAHDLGRDADAARWKRLAAECGDTGAMYELITLDHRDDPVACWTWVYLARLHGNDLTEDDYRAIHGDGSDYDDDVGGPLLVDGRSRVELGQLDAARDRAARDAAQAIYARTA